jgi:hypothetical protein
VLNLRSIDQGRSAECVRILIIGIFRGEGGAFYVRLGRLRLAYLTCR